MQDNNPYAIPSVMNAPMQGASPSQLSLASQGQRFVTLIIDNVFLGLLNYFVGFLLGIIFIVASGGPQAAQNGMMMLQIISFFVSIAVAFAYFVLLEGTTGMTIGKMAMGTKVVSANGQKPTMGQIMGRTACRYIPFEAFSFFGNNGFPIGWHDKIPGTIVIKTR